MAVKITRPGGASFRAHCENYVCHAPQLRRTSWRKCLALALCLSAAGVAGCAAGPNAQVGKANDEGDVAGFWLGLWHGTILPVAFVVSLFDRDVGVYEARNRGPIYDLGFLLGVGGNLGGGPAIARRRRHRQTNNKE